ncbi:Bug family tripartite tricarboxylate transporter substrate binding protein [Ramlibacter rhizophilus]|uniref:Twin-arginine translocation pathway signal protein n=1 Tax=Ramlibacter rhizophilus TaxID=1781167 RepID=A0A4Z0BNC4_9BURK|nr:Bug family tripartite tricarboxylate transporter substrate binding protein [Ramlibacter rhizophilus]TFY99747.1 twin-arginine translocation pathway signal protein [Ramlibacter rhizophilus]
MFTRRHFVHASAAAVALAGFGRSAWAQSPETAKVIIGFAPGGTIDLVARRVADRMAPAYARNVIVENKTGAGGQIAVQAVNTAAPDGSTILLTPASPLALHPHTFKKLPYDPVADLAPVSGAVSFDYALAVGPMVPASVKTVPDFLAWAKANPAQANFGSAGNGSAAHFMGAALADAGKVKVQHIAFRGSQPAILDMVGGQLAAVIGPTGEFMSQAQAGKVRLLGTSGKQRGRFTPDVGTFAEQGYKDVQVVGWFGYYVPARTPQEVVQRLNASIRSGLADKDVIDSLAKLYMEPMPTTPAELGALQKAESEFWAGVARSIGFTPSA